MQNDNNQNTIDFPQTNVAPAAEVTNDATQPNLGAAREAKRLSVGDAAYALKVSPRVIEALEAGNWSVLPGRTFTVGILRAYGRLLDVPVDALVDAVPGAASNATRAMAQSAAAPKPRRDGEPQRQANRARAAPGASPSGPRPPPVNSPRFSRNWSGWPSSPRSSEPVSRSSSPAPSWVPPA